MSRHWTAPRAVVSAIAVIILAGNAAAQVPCACEGRCQYGVDGACVPRAATYGYYHSNWRRWPVEPPRVRIPAALPTPSADLRLPVNELPEPRDEADVVPEFPHLRKRPTAPGADGNTPSGTDTTEDPFQDDPVPSFDLPDDDSASRGPALKRLIATKPAGHRFVSAGTSQPQDQVRTVAASSNIVSGNPLRNGRAALAPPRPLPGVESTSRSPSVTHPPMPAAQTVSRSSGNPLRGN